jgi:hypothetical protein
MLPEEPLPATEAECAEKPQTGAAILWRTLLYLIVLPGAVLLAIKWLFGA